MVLIVSLWQSWKICLVDRWDWETPFPSNYDALLAFFENDSHTEAGIPFVSGDEALMWIVISATLHELWNCSNISMALDEITCLDMTKYLHSGNKFNWPSKRGTNRISDTEEQNARQNQSTDICLHMKKCASLLSHCWWINQWKSKLWNSPKCEEIQFLHSGVRCNRLDLQNSQMYVLYFSMSMLSHLSHDFIIIGKIQELIDEWDEYHIPLMGSFALISRLRRLVEFDVTNHNQWRMFTIETISVRLEQAIISSCCRHRHTTDSWSK